MNLSLRRNLATALCLLWSLVCAAPVQAQQAVGDWHGNLAVGAINLRLGVHLKAKPDGKLAGTIVSPDQGPQAIPISDVAHSGTSLSFAVPQINGRFEGEWDAKRKAWAGNWIQGAPLPLVLLPGKLAPSLRPQEPRPPYPYGSQEVTIESAPGVQLAGTLTTPTGEGPFPAALLITGSGAQNRDEELMGHKPFLVIADYLTRQGIAVLRLDDRGTAKSTGRFATATGTDFAVDASAAVRWLRGQPSINARKVGLIGHSEGAVIAPMVANQDAKVAFVVLLAAPGVPLRELLSAQAEAIFTAQALPQDLKAKRLAGLKKVNEAMIAAKTTEERKAAASKIFAEAGVSASEAAPQVEMVSTPWFAQLVAYDPAPALAQLRIPVLALNGEKDLQVLAKQNLAAIRTATQGNSDVTIIELPGLNHLFQTSTTGHPGEYGKIEETFSPAALKHIADWIKKRT